jgi:hypothetical protein
MRNRVSGTFRSLGSFNFRLWTIRPNSELDAKLESALKSTGLVSLVRTMKDYPGATAIVRNAACGSL